MSLKANSAISQIAEDAIDGLKACGQLDRFAAQEKIASKQSRDYLIRQLNRESQGGRIDQWLYDHVWECSVPSGFRVFIKKSLKDLRPPEDSSPLSFIRSWVTTRGIPDHKELPKPRQSHHELRVRVTAQVHEPDRQTFEQITRAYELTRRILRYLCWYYHWSLTDESHRRALFDDEPNNGDPIISWIEQSSVAALAKVIDRVLECYDNPFANREGQLSFQVINDQSRKVAESLQDLYEALRKEDSSHSKEFSTSQLVTLFFEKLRKLLDLWQSHRHRGGTPPRFIPRGCWVKEVRQGVGTSSATAISEENDVTYELVSIPPIVAGSMLLLPAIPSATVPIELVCEHLQCLPVGDPWCDREKFEATISHPLESGLRVTHIAALVIAAKSDEEFDEILKKASVGDKASSSSRGILDLKSLSSTRMVPWHFIQELDKKVGRLPKGFQSMLYALTKDGHKIQEVVDLNQTKLIFAWLFKDAIDQDEWKKESGKKTKLKAIAYRIRKVFGDRLIPNARGGLFRIEASLNCYLVKPGIWPLQFEDIQEFAVLGTLSQ